ncbi:MAG: RNA polymerase sigma factor [Pseudomonadales bacterium]
MTPAIEAALTEHYRDFLRYLVRRVGDVATAEDVLQSFCIRVLRSETVLRNEGSVVAWLYTVLRSVMTDTYRKEAVKRRRDASYVNDQIALGDDYTETEPVDGICGCVSSLLPKLRPVYAEVLQRVDLAGSARDKVATELGISATNMRVRLHRARLAVGKALRDHCGGCCETGFRDCFCSRECNHSGQETPQDGLVL